MLAAVTEYGVSNETLADAVGDDLLEVLLQHHATGEQVGSVGPAEDLPERCEAADHFLAASGTRVYRFQPQRATLEQLLGRWQGVLEGKHTDALQHHLAHSLRKHRGPAFGRLGLPVQ
ncbi:hypothetical protein D3C81_1790710 [compost metagenome]